MNLEKILQDYNPEKDDPAELLAALVAHMRPPQPSQSEHATHAVQALCYLLDRDPAKAAVLRDAILRLLGQRKPVSLFVDSGIPPSSGFFTELWRRFSHKLLPDAVNPNYLKDLFPRLFADASDEQWVLAVPDEVWLELLRVLRLETAPPALIESCQRSLLDAVHVLSYRISATGLEPELLRNHPELENHASPFIVQNIELGSFLAEYQAKPTDAKHMLVMLDQCLDVISKIRRNMAQTGTSIALTHVLQRLTQQIRRLEMLLTIIDSVRSGQNADLAYIALFKTLVHGECHKNDIRQHMHGNVELLALRVTENASQIGEHYITETRSEYFELMFSAMGAGLIIAVMAMIKIMLAEQHYAPLTETILFSLNYGIGFVIIHILHFTVATKQPAMTAAAIAASIDSSEGKFKKLDRLVNIISQMTRSQLIAIIGNVIVAIPCAMLIGGLIYWMSGAHFVSVEKAYRLLADNDPLQSGAVFYAGIAGVCLFLSGLIAGYHDNMAIYNKIPQRLRALGWLNRLLGEQRLDRVSNYIENNLGALAGNFYFGCLLGGMSGLGVLLGLPIDIRHITFSSGFIGFSFVGLEFVLSLNILLMAALGLLLIGFMNLTVSFFLALYVAMKSRRVNFRQWRQLLIALLQAMYRQPRQFLLPPSRQQQLEQLQDAHVAELKQEQEQRPAETKTQ